MATTETDVTMINKALARFAGGEIGALDEASPLAATCSDIYSPLRDYLLCIHPWRFAMKKRQLALSASETPINEWTKAFPLPADILSGPWAVFGDGRELPSHMYEIYNGFVYCDYDTVIMDYTARIDESAMPPWFKGFLITATAADLCVPIADQVSKSEALRAIAFGPPADRGRGGLFAQCRRLDGQTQPTRSLFMNGDPLTAARFGGVVPSVEGEVP